MRQNLIRHHSVWPFSSPLKREACCPSGQEPPPPRTSTPPEASTRLRGPLGRPPPGKDRVLSVHTSLGVPQVGLRSPSRPHLPRRFRRKRPTFSPSAPAGAPPTPLPLPAGGTTAGLPNPSPADRPASPPICRCGTFCVNRWDRPRRGGTQKKPGGTWPWRISGGGRRGRRRP